MMLSVNSFTLVTSFSTLLRVMSQTVLIVAIVGLRLALDLDTAGEFVFILV